MDQEKIGRFIAKCRKEKELTQEQLANIINVNTKVVSKWENGLSVPHTLILMQLCEALDITVSELLNAQKKSLSHNEIENDKNNDINKLEKIEGGNPKKKLFNYLIIIVVIMCFISFFVFFSFRNTDKDKNCVYVVTSKDNRFLINGIITNNQNQNFLSINTLGVDSQLNNSLYAFQYSLIVDSTVVYQIGNLSLYDYNSNDPLFYFNDKFNEIDIYIEEDSKTSESVLEDILSKNIILEILYLDEELSVNTIEVPLAINEVN